MGVSFKGWTKDDLVRQMRYVESEISDGQKRLSRHQKEEMRMLKRIRNLDLNWWALHRAYMELLKGEQ